TNGPFPPHCCREPGGKRSTTVSGTATDVAAVAGSRRWSSPRVRAERLCDASPPSLRRAKPPPCGSWLSGGAPSALLYSVHCNHYCVICPILFAAQRKASQVVGQHRTRREREGAQRCTNPERIAHCAWEKPWGYCTATNRADSPHRLHYDAR